MTRVLVALVLLAALLAGCGGDDRDADRASGATASEQEPLQTLRISHPATLAFAAPFESFDLDGPLEGLAGEVDRGVWATPDVLRAQLIEGESDVTAVPSYVAANLHNKGVDVRMAAVTVWGLLWLIGPEGAPADWDALRGETVMVPFPNDMPDLVLRYLAEANGLVPGEDFEVDYSTQPPEVVNRLVSGKGTWAVLPEHVATVALTKSNEQGRRLTRALDLQEQWAEATGLPARIPQAGIIVPGRLAGERPTLVAAVLDELESTVSEVNEASSRTVAELAEGTGLPAPVVEQVIPRLNLDVVAAADARPELERFYQELAKLSPDIIGGRLPGDDFYLEDPR